MALTPSIESQVAKLSVQICSVPFPIAPPGLSRSLLPEKRENCIIRPPAPHFLFIYSLFSVLPPLPLASLPHLSLGSFLNCERMGSLTNSSVCHVGIQNVGPSWATCSWVPGTLTHRLEPLLRSSWHLGYEKWLEPGVIQDETLWEGGKSLGLSGRVPVEIPANHRDLLSPRGDNGEGVKARRPNWSLSSCHTAKRPVCTPPTLPFPLT